MSKIIALFGVRLFHFPPMYNLYRCDLLRPCVIGIPCVAAPDELDQRPNSDLGPALSTVETYSDGWVSSATSISSVDVLTGIDRQRLDRAMRVLRLRKAITHLPEKALASSASFRAPVAKEEGVQGRDGPSLLLVHAVSTVLTYV